MTNRYENELTVLTCTYNGETATNLMNYFEGLLKQTYKKFEVILCIDGGIRQELENIISKYAEKITIKIIRNTKIGLGKNLNIGLNHVQTKYTIRHDTDDVSHVNRFEKQLMQIKKIGADVISGPIFEHQRGNTNIKSVPQGRVYKYSILRFFKNPVNHNCCIFKTDKITSIGYSDYRMEDFILWSKLLNNGDIIYNTDIPLLDANAESLHSRRVGADYRKAEFQLFWTNLSNMTIVFAPLIIFAFCIRYPLRFNFMSSVLKIALKSSRK